MPTPEEEIKNSISELLVPAEMEGTILSEILPKILKDMRERRDAIMQEIRTEEAARKKKEREENKRQKETNAVWEWETQLRQFKNDTGNDEES